MTRSPSTRGARRALLAASIALPHMALAASDACPTALPESGVTVDIVTTGIIDAQWSVVVNNGREGPVQLPLLVGVIRHPEGTVLVDSGLGQTTRDGTFPRFPLSTGGAVHLPDGWIIAERLQTPPKLVLMTHLHYDHIGGLFDLPGVDVWTTQAEWLTTMTSNLGFPETRIKDVVNWRVLPLREGRAQSYMGRPAADVLGDGTIWYISTPGHTPGGASVLVRAEDAVYLFVGDAAWVDDHLGSARRPWWVSLVIDGRPKQLNTSLRWIRDFLDRCPHIKAVAGHEPRWAETLPGLPRTKQVR
jgi:N-acyl homoserine lactone hydrolase